jgi:hypothetical protein
MKQIIYTKEQRVLMAKLSLPTTCIHPLYGAGEVSRVVIPEGVQDIILMCTFGASKLGFLYSQLAKIKLKLPKSFCVVLAQLFETVPEVIASPRIPPKSSNSESDMEEVISVTDIADDAATLESPCNEVAEAVDVEVAPVIEVESRPAVEELTESRPTKKKTKRSERLEVNEVVCAVSEAEVQEVQSTELAEDNFNNVDSPVISEVEGLDINNVI